MNAFIYLVLQPDEISIIAVPLTPAALPASAQEQVRDAVRR